MNLILVTDNLDYSQPIAVAATAAGYRILKHVGPNDEVLHYIKSMRPDALIIVSYEIDREILREMRSVTAERPTPMLVFTRDSKTASIEAAVKAGASAYVVDCDDTSRLASLLDVARVRFQEQCRVHEELQSARSQLSDRKKVEKAKGIIMKTKNLNEDDAYKVLRKLAMDNNKKIGEISGQIITAAEVLV